MFMINNGTEWNPIRSVFLRVINKSDICEAGVRFVVTSMITDRIKRHEVLLSINQD